MATLSGIFVAFSGLSISRASHKSDHTCSAGDDFVDTFGIAGGTGANEEKPFAGIGSRVMTQVKCDFTYQEFDENSMATLNWYPDARDFEDYKAIDMVPKRHWEYLRGELGSPGLNESVKWEMGKNGPLKQKETIKLGECQIPQADGGAFHIQRVGPFYSTGGYDWWQVGWRDTWRMSEVLKKHPEGVYYTTSFSGAVDQDGKILGYPPVHIHHIHICPQPCAKKKMLKGMKYHPNFGVEQHGDYECLKKDGGANCFFEVPALENVKELDRVFDLEGEVNDVRSPGSKTMVWYYQTALRWHPKSSYQGHPLSQSFIIKFEPFVRNQTAQNLALARKYDSPMPLMGKHNQQEELMTFDLDTTEYHIAWGNGYQDWSGELVRNKLHSHTVLFEEAYWFRASAEDLGLVNGTVQFPFNDWYEITRLKDTGLKSLEEVKDYLFSNLEKATRKHEAKCSLKKGPSFLNPRAKADECNFNAPFMVCYAKVNNERIRDPEVNNPGHPRGFTYDRRARSCCNEWSFKPGEVWTTVGFYKPMEEVLGPWSLTKPAKFPEHLHWVTTFRMTDSWARPDHSYYLMQKYVPATSKFPPTVGVGTFYLAELCVDDPKCTLDDDMSEYLAQHHWKDGKFDDVSHDDWPTDEASAMQVSLEQFITPNKHVQSLLRQISSQSALVQTCSLLVGVLLTITVVVLCRKTMKKEMLAGTEKACACAPPPCCPCVQVKQVQKLQ
jgi:hypothetical protein